MENQQNLIHPLDVEKNNMAKIPMQKALLIFLIVLVAGIISGFATFKIKSQISGKKQTGGKVIKTAGIANKKTFKDGAEGILREGGIDGEGNFHLERKGGESQTAYLTSTTVDLSSFVGKKVRVWGETFKGQKAAWLMDVGLVELLE